MRLDQLVALAAEVRAKVLPDEGDAHALARAVLDVVPKYEALVLNMRRDRRGAANPGALALELAAVTEERDALRARLA